MKNYLAYLLENQGELIIEISNDKTRKAAFRESDLNKRLDSLRELLGFKNLKELDIYASKGDESVFDIPREYDKEGFNFSIQENLIKNFEDQLDKSLDKEVQNELKDNFLCDLAASSLDAIFEDFTFAIIKILQELSITKLRVQGETLVDKRRLIDIIGKTLPIIDIEVEII